MKQERTRRYGVRRAWPWTGLVVRAVVLAWAGMAAMVGMARADTIYLATGRNTKIDNVTITRAKWDNIGYTWQGSPQAVEGYKVARLERPSPSLSRLSALIQNGDFVAAEKAIKKSRSLGLKDWEKTKLGYLEGVLYLDWASRDASKVSDAIKVLTSYVKNFESTKDFYVPHAIFALGRAYMSKKTWTSAQKEFKRLGAFGGTKGIWAYRGMIGQAQAIINEGQRSKITDARVLLRRVIGDRKAPRSVQNEAIVIRAASFNVVKDYKQAVAEIRKNFFNKRGDNGGTQYDESYARACNVMGDAYRFQGGKGNLQQAEIWYLRTTCFFKTYPAEYRVAVGHLVEVYDGLGDKKRSEQWKKRLQ